MPHLELPHFLHPSLFSQNLPQGCKRSFVGVKLKQQMQLCQESL